MTLPNYYSRLSPFREHFSEGFPILCYHKIAAPPPRARIKGLYLEPNLFRQQIQELAAEGFSFVSPAEQDQARAIAITFDDGPHPQNTPRLLDILAARNVKATFYVIGRSVDLHPGVLSRTVAEGHEIGNHSHTHRLLSKLSESEVRLEMQRCHDAVGRAAGVRMRTMRPPYGGLLQSQRELVHQEFGYPTILWSVDPLDWKRPGPSVVTSRILSGTTKGGIVLAHDLHSQTVDAMPATLDGLLRKGFKFVTVSQLIAMKMETPEAQASLSSTN